MAETCLTVDLNAIAANHSALDALSSHVVETAAVLKANAYGLGIEKVGRKFLEKSVRTFFVATTEEAAALADVIGPDAHIYVFGGFLPQDKALFQNYDFIPLLNSIDQVRAYIEHPNQSGFGLQIDTGMNRLGMEEEELRGALNILGDRRPELVISHLACADDPTHKMNGAQLAEFHRLSDGMNWRRSLAATGGTLLGAEYHFDVTRPGIGLYGGAPFQKATSVIRLDIPVIQTRHVAIGESVGYGSTWVAERPSVVATLSAGYADGLLRTLGNGHVDLFADTIRCPLVGRVSMDLLTVDVTDLDHVPDYMTLLNSEQTVDDLAAAAGTIGYEFLTGLGARYQRRYVGAV
ncbi:MAG: alanine racemase [Pseudomonadota bacterium]